MLQLRGWTRQPHQCSHPTLSISWLLCFYILPAKTATQKMQMSIVCGITRGKHWLHRQCESLFTLQGLKNFLSTFFQQTHISTRLNQQGPKSSVCLNPLCTKCFLCILKPLHTVVDLCFWYVETNLERLNTLLKAVFCRTHKNSSEQ